MAKPTVRVRIAFADGPYVASPTWTDVTSYVRAINTSRGRTDDWQNFDSGSATVVLDNRDRRFDPMYSSGPYYGNLQPRRQIRIDATTDSVNYFDVFRGYVDGWPVELTDAGYDSTVTVSCYDVLGLIAQNTIPADWSDNYITSLNPTHYWRMNKTIDPSGLPTTSTALASYTFDDVGTGNAPMVPLLESRPISNCDPLGLAVVGNAISFSNGATPWADGRAYSGLTGNPIFTFASWHTFQDSARTTAPIVFQGNFLISGQYSTVSLDYDMTNQRFEVYIAPYAASSTYRMYYYNTGLNIAVAHHIAITMTLTSTNTATISALIVDGVVLTQTSTTTFTKPPTTGLTYATLSLGEGSNQQIILHEGSEWSTTQLRTIYQLGNNVLTETTAARFSRVIAQTPLPAAMYSCTGSPAGTVGRLTVGGNFVNNELQLAADSEGGELYTTRGGVLTMTNRTWYQSGNSATNQATFGSGGLPIGTTASYSWNADNIRNSLDVSWSGEGTVNCSDATSKSTYGVMQASYDTALSTYADAQTLGNLLVGFGKLPRLVMSAVEVGQALSAAQWVTVLGLELLDRITVVIPESVGSNLSQVQLVQQIEHTITPGDWKTTILGSARWSSVFTLNSSTLDGTDLLG